MNRFGLSRRGALRFLASAPLLSAGTLRAGTAEDFAAGLARDRRLLAFATPHAPEVAAPLRTVAGRLPAELTGTLWRNGPAEHDRFGHRYGHWFDGDGMLQAFTFDGAGVTHRGRILDTPKRRRETRAGRRALPAFGTVPPDPDAIRRPDDMNAANTSMLAHGERLLALWEGGSALDVDPETLATRGFVRWRDDLAGLPFGAHPKRERDGTVWNIGVTINPRPMLLLYRIDPAGKLAGFGHLPVDPLGMVHDFVVTERRLVALLPPFVVEPERFASGHVSFLDAHAWRPELGTRVLVFDKDTLAPVARHALPAGFHFHHGNGWEERDGTIHLDVCQAPGPQFVLRDLRAPMHGEWRFPSVHPGYRRVALRPGGPARIDDAAPGVAGVSADRSAARGTASPQGLHAPRCRANGVRSGRLGPATRSESRPRRRGRGALVLPSAPAPRGARVRTPWTGRGRRVAARPVPGRGAPGSGASRLRRAPAGGRAAMGGDPALPDAPGPARDFRRGLTEEPRARARAQSPWRTSAPRGNSVTLEALRDEGWPWRRASCHTRSSTSSIGS